MSNRQERHKERLKRRISRLFDSGHMNWRGPNFIEVWPTNQELAAAVPEELDDDGLHPDAIYIRQLGLNYTMTYRRGALEWSGDKLSEAARLYKTIRLLVT
jgi:hypothetical protein